MIKTCDNCVNNAGRAGDYVRCKIRNAYYIEFYNCSNWKEKVKKNEKKKTS